MVLVRRWVLVLSFLLAGGLHLFASQEETAFQAALRDLHSSLYERADVKFGEFIQTYTNSTRLPEALLYQAEARLKLGKAAGAMELLSGHLAQAGKWTDPYLYYLGEAYAQSGDFHKARDTFGDLLQRFPASTNALKAAVEQAMACSKLQEWPHVTALLEQTNGVFQVSVRTHPADEFVQRGLLLLSEAWLQQPNAPQRFASAEAALQPLAKMTLKPDIDWYRQDLLCRILRGNGRIREALQNTTNLLAAAGLTGARDLLARSYEFRASLLEGMRRFDEAIAAYTNNLVDGVPDDLRRWALLQSTKLFLDQQKTTNAIQTLERFVGQYSNAPAADVALLTLGELHLGQFIAGYKTNALDTLAGMNVPTNATARLQEVVRRFPQSPFVPKAQLDLGWCFWMGRDLTNAQAQFQTAAQRLPTANEQAVAYFKLADTQARLGDYSRALSNYNVVIDKSVALPEVRADLEEAALYQIVYVGLKAGDLAAATNAMGALLAQFPDGFHTAPAVLLAGQALGHEGHADRARAILQEFAARATNAPAEVHLALARTWEEEGNWTNAIRLYTEALSACTNNARVRAEAEFYRAQATWRAGDLTNALMLHTNFIAHYPEHPKAPVAQFWVGDYYFNLGNPSAAEFNYQKLCEEPRWRSSELVYRARMMAGRAAFQQALYNNAVNDFTNLTGIVNCPSNLWVEAMFAYGDCELSQLTKDRGDTNNLAHLNQAKSLFNSIAESYPGTPPMLLALGRKADTLVQLAQYSGENSDCTNALSIYHQISTNTTADVTVRSLAEVGAAVALQMLADQKSGGEQAALLRQALDHCLNVANGALLGPEEKGDPNWTLKAGDMAVELAADLQDWTAAIGLCHQLERLFPALSTRYAERAKVLGVHLSNLTRN